MIHTVKVDAVYPHPMDSGYDLVMIQDTPIAVQRGSHKIGDTVIHFQPGMVVDGVPVSVTFVGGLPSHGYIMSTDLDVGLDLTAYYHATYIKPIRPESGPFHRYSPVPSYYDTSGRFKIPQIPVQITEKVNGVQSRLGYIDSKFLCGSKLCVEDSQSLYGKPLTTNMQRLLVHLSNGTHSVMAFGEIYGSKVTSMDYGTYGSDGYVLYDISVDGVYLDRAEFAKSAKAFSIETAPVLYEGIYSSDIADQVSHGNTSLSEPNRIRSANKGREGAIIIPMIEQKFIDGSRMILQSTSN